MSKSAGIHHVTAICSDPRRNVAFYTDALGLRMVKRTVNFDDPTTWHLYYGDETGSPGTALTFFAWAIISARPQRRRPDRGDRLRHSGTLAGLLDRPAGRKRHPA